MRDENKNIIPLWGPYSKKYMGISRIMKESAVPGARFDFVIHPTYANSNVPAPNVTIPSEYHPWDCDSNGKYYRYRYELLWKDQLYADVDFFEIEEETWGIRVSFHNNTDKNQNCLINYFAAEEYPKSRVYTKKVPEKVDAWNAVDYENLGVWKSSSMGTPESGCHEKRERFWSMDLRMTMDWECPTMHSLCVILD